MGISRAAWLIAAALVLLSSQPMAQTAPMGGVVTVQPASSAQVAESLAHAVGLLAYIYGLPAVEYGIRMRDETTRGLSPDQTYAPVSAIFNNGRLAVPGLALAGRQPNTDTVYFTAWLDLRSGPVTFQVPDMGKRYYALTFADFYSEVQHTGTRATGNARQAVMVVGPNWRGEAPEGAHLVRMATNQALMFGRVYAKDADEEPLVDRLIGAIRIEAPPQTAAPLALPDHAVLDDLGFFKALNRFLRDNPRKPGEEALMAQFDQIGIGPKAEFDPDKAPAPIRKGLEEAMAEGRAMLESPASMIRPGKIPQLGVYGYDYMLRAGVERFGLLANRPEEAIYTGLGGPGPFNGSNAYRVVFPKGATPPVDGFWSLTPYDMRSRDLIPNAAKVYSIRNVTPGLKYRADGALEIRIQARKPTEPDVNWLPVTEGTPYTVMLRLYMPRKAIIDGSWTAPLLEQVPGK